MGACDPTLTLFTSSGLGDADEPRLPQARAVGAGREAQPAEDRPSDRRRSSGQHQPQWHRARRGRKAVPGLGRLMAHLMGPLGAAVGHSRDLCNKTFGHSVHENYKTRSNS